MLYYSIVYPHLIDGIEALGAANKSIINKTEVAQKKIIGGIESAHYLHTVHLCLSDCICSRFQICMNCTQQMHLYNKDSLPTPLKELFIRNRHNHSYETRQRALPRLNKFKLSIASKSFNVVGPKLWSSVESSVRNISTTNIFINHYEALIINHNVFCLTRTKILNVAGWIRFVYCFVSFFSLPISQHSNDNNLSLPFLFQNYRLCTHFVSFVFIF